MPIGEPMGVPPVAQLPAFGPQRENWTLPVQFAAPPTVTVAESLTGETKPVPMETDPVGLEVVVIDEEQLPKVARTKLFNTADVEVDDRLSARVVAKHSLASPGKLERSMPPS